MEREVDKVEKYIKTMCKKYGGSWVEARLSSYYNINGRILRVSDHIGTNSSGNISIIIPKYRHSEDMYFLHAHNTGDLSIVDYNEVKTIIHSFVYMSAMFNAITQPKFQAELEKNETLIGSHEITKMKEEYKKLKTIEKKYDGLRKKYEEQKKKINELISGATEVSICNVDSEDTILGVPKDLFEPGQLQVITQTANKVKTKHNLQIKEEATD
jgi:hypothetical protein